VYWAASARLLAAFSTKVAVEYYSLVKQIFSDIQTIKLIINTIV